MRPYSTRILSNDIISPTYDGQKRRELEMTFEVIVQQFRCRRERLEPNPAAEIDTWSHPASRGKIAGYTQADIEPSSAPINRLSACSISPPYVSASAGHLLVKALVEPDVRKPNHFVKSGDVLPREATFE